MESEGDTGAQRRSPVLRGPVRPLPARVCPLPQGWSSAPPWRGAPHVGVLHTQHDVAAGAGAAVLPQQAARLQQRRLARHPRVPRPPGFAVVGGQTDPRGAGAVPDQLLRPGDQGTGTLSQGLRRLSQCIMGYSEHTKQATRILSQGSDPLIKSVLPGPPDREHRVTLD